MIFVLFHSFLKKVQQNIFSLHTIYFNILYSFDPCQNASHWHNQLKIADELLTLTLHSSSACIFTEVKSEKGVIQKTLILALEVGK